MCYCFGVLQNNLSSKRYDSVGHGVRVEHVRVSGWRIQVRDRKARPGTARRQEEVLHAEEEGTATKVSGQLCFYNLILRCQIMTHFLYYYYISLCHLSANSLTFISPIIHCWMSTRGAATPIFPWPPILPGPLPGYI